VKGAIHDPRARGLQGKRAGVVSRGVATLVDAGVVFVVYLALLFVYGVVRFLVERHSVELARPDPALTGALVWLLAVVYCAVAWSGSGRTPGQSVVGLRVVTAAGGPVGAAPALVRSLLFVTFPEIALLTVLVSRRNHALHDVMTGTAVVYDWRVRMPGGAAPAGPPVT